MTGKHEELTRDNSMRLIAQHQRQAACEQVAAVTVTELKTKVRLRHLRKSWSGRHSVRTQHL